MALGKWFKRKKDKEADRTVTNAPGEDGRPEGAPRGPEEDAAGVTPPAAVKPEKPKKAGLFARLKSGLSKRKPAV